MQGQGFRDRAPEFDDAGAVIVGASFDTVEEQKAFADAEAFPYALLADTTREVGAAYDAVREPGEPYFEAGIPRRISYLIDPAGVIRRTYDLTGQDLASHAQVVLDDIRALS